ncbi:hypothetical protein [uncultured Desulfobacter sp.]|uniref:hypothetical protein n=1 Tax=uncultured Desulfobacter sp. TaxID=240139 RepID=UPI002AAC2A1D|nr:hypothetical protein [uncultured Desulfobacter sp.]
MKKLFIIAVLLVIWAGSVHASSEWEFYGSARISTFYTNWNVDVVDGSGANPIAGTGGNTDSYEQDLNGNARIGANVKVNDSLTARFEYGAKRGDANIRILMGEWNFGAGSLGVGQDYTPLLFPYSNQVYNIYALKDGDTNMSLLGMLYGKREPMVRLKFGTFQIAAVKPRLLVNSYYSIATGSIDAPQSGPDTQVVIPNIQAKYRLDFNWGHINMAGGFQKFDVEDSGESWDVTSYVLALGGRLNIGKAYLKGNIWGGQNVGNLADILVNGQIFSTYDNISAVVRDGAGVGYAQWSDGTIYTVTGGASGYEKGIIDNDALAALCVAGYEIKRGLYVEAGYGYTRTKLDMDGAEKDDCHTTYLQSTIFLAEGVFVTPEIGYINMVQDGQPTVFYAGIKWQINF